MASFRGADRRATAQSPASPSRCTYTGRQTAPRSTTTRRCPYPCQRSLPVCVAPLAPLGSFHPPTEYIKPPAEVQNYLPRLANSISLHYGSTRVSEEGCSTRCFYHPAARPAGVASWSTVDSTKVNLPLLVRIFEKEKNVAENRKFTTPHDVWNLKTGSDEPGE